jgi:hypothetical protein
MMMTTHPKVQKKAKINLIFWKWSFRWIFRRKPP